MIRICPDCNVTYETKLSRQKKCDGCKFNTCKFCSKTYRPNRYASKYCSWICKNENMKGFEPIALAANRGKKPRTYLRNKRKKHGCAEDREWRSEIFKRDNFTCQLCWKSGGKLQADHIKSFSAYPELRFDLSNGRTLCVLCHAKTPNYGYRAVKEIAAKRMAQEVLL